MPESIELTWVEYRLVAQALDDAENELARVEPATSPLLTRVREALRLVLRLVWPDLGAIDDEGTLEP
jgi:hypothetical protein